MQQLTTLDDFNILFPCPSLALSQPNGLLAVGGDLSNQRLFSAYQQGIFPWYNTDDPILWWSPDPRCVIFTHKFHVSKSFKRFLHKKEYTVTINKCFDDVIRGCQQPRSYQKETWINNDIVQAYTKLHQLKQAHSIEVWHNHQLIGGVYGVMTDHIFCGESMFSLRQNASKVALYSLCKLLSQHDIALIDCQIPNDHLISLGAQKMRRSDFLTYLSTKPQQKSSTINWHPQNLNY